MKTNQFIEKARKVHGDKYDYLKTEYINIKTKVCIICPEHGEFWQKPGNHLNGSGCILCGYEARKKKIALTNEQFIQKAKEVHGDKYDYSKVNYIDNHTKVCIICPEHGEFWQKPGNHLRGHGCVGCFTQQCVERFALSQEEFITRCKSIHEDKYDYSKVEYKNNSTKVCIICPKHGEFWQEARLHMNGGNCPLCNKLSQEEFINRSNKIHYDKYDYSKVIYKNIRSKVCIICPEHGEFWQTPKLHMNGRGCSNCHVGKDSKISKRIEHKLNELNIKYIKEHTFDWLKYKNNLLLDFYLPDYNIAIECHGEQHFKPVQYFGGEEKYIKTCKTDLVKYNLCKEHGIKVYYFTDVFQEYFENIFTNEEILFNNILKNINYD